ncbi:MAG TPA: HesA/MoeB/ThiF family protein [Allosphingosinicella sp.]
MTLTDDQLDRYARQIVLRQIGGEGQKRLLAARVVVVGAGGIGSPAIQYLAAAGVGRIAIIDDDRVELSNLQRQILFGARDLGQSKAHKARETVAALNPDVEIQAVPTRIDASNACRLLAGADVVLDGTDTFKTRLLVADAALALHIPLVSASVGEFEGQLAVYRGWDAGNPCYRCLVGGDPERPGRSCADLGVLGAAAGVMGSLAALEITRCITGFGEDSAGKLLLMDALTLRFRTVGLRKDPGCPACAA